MNTTKIEWTERTWNPVTGCTKVSPGCDNCYAETMHERFNGKGSFAIVTRNADRLYTPMTWRKPAVVFVNSMSDLFHNDVPERFIVHVFATMARTPQHTYQVLTKRHGRMRAMLRRPEFRAAVANCIGPNATIEWPLPNVWLGVSVENQKWADVRVSPLLDTPAAVRFLSCEPLLGPVDLSLWLNHYVGASNRQPPALDWVIVGGESGPRARPMHPGWVRSLRDQCTGAGVAFFYKQWGAWAPSKQLPSTTPVTGRTRSTVVDGKTVYRVGKKAAGRELDGRTWDEMPAREKVPA